MNTRAAVPSVRHSACTGALLVVSLVAQALTPGCHSTPTFPLRTAHGALPNVLLITVDSLRPDHLGAYGFPVATSPAIDRLAARGVRITEAITTAPDTAPAIASLLTGLYQYRSKVLFDGGSLPANVATLAERLGAAGYRTAGFVGTDLLSTARGFGRGFDHFETFGEGSARTALDADGADAAIAWLDGNAAHPWFLWVHFVAPHGPYTSADESWSASYEYPPYMFGRNAPLIIGPSDFGLGVLPKYQRIDGSTRPSDFIRRYDGEIRYTDAQVGRLQEAIARTSSADETLTILTADHGESLTEHRELFQHGWFLYDSTLHVPLVLAWPGVLPAGRVVRRQVSSVDLVPTLTELLGLASLVLPPDGTSFATHLLTDNDAPTRPVFAIGARENRPVAMRWAGWKLVHVTAGRPPMPLGLVPPAKLDTPERVELYALTKDPGEGVNIAHRHEGIRTSMQQVIERFRSSLRTNPAAR